MSSRSGVPPSELDVSDDDAVHGEDATEDDPLEHVGKQERTIAAGRAPETPFAMILAVTACVLGLVVIALAAVALAVWAS